VCPDPSGNTRDPRRALTEPSDTAYARHLARVIESSDDAIVSKDLSGTITSWNRAAERIFGYTTGEAVGSSIRMIVPADRQAEEDEVLATIKSGGTVDHIETVRQRKDGTCLTISLTVWPIRNDQGEIVGASKIARDVSDRAHLRELERENSRLYVEAREASRMKDEFLAVLSHELRTPLNAIVGYARLLRGGLLTGEKAERGLDALDRNSTWLARIVEEVLDVSRIVSGKLRLDVQPVELPLVVHNAVATMQPAADAKGVRMQTTVDSRVGPVAGDRDRLHQVVWHLVSNAVKFTPTSGRVQILLERVNSHVEIVVADTGVGIRREFLPCIFDRFSQAESSTTRKLGGLGLGLAIVRHIVELHGGTVDAFSAGENQGTTVRVRLPLMVVHTQPAEDGRQPPTSERLEPLHELGDLQGVRVFAVDDEEDSLVLLKTVLEAAGARVTAVASPQRALGEIGDANPDVVLLDLGMPEIDGFELIRRIRASSDEGVRRTPAAALTAFARSEDRTKALQSGFEMHLTKPIDPAELVASVATLVRRGRA
jgi:PAS domain S-box-containing protein